MEIEGQQYTIVVTKDFTLRINETDSYQVILQLNRARAREVVRVCLYSVMNSLGNVIIAGKKCTRLKNYYNFFMESLKLGIFKMSKPDKKLHFWTIENVKEKYIVIPICDSTFLCVPLVQFFH